MLLSVRTAQSVRREVAERVATPDAELLAYIARLRGARLRRSEEGDWNEAARMVRR